MTCLNCRKNSNSQAFHSIKMKIRVNVPLTHISYCPPNFEQIKQFRRNSQINRQLKPNRENWTLYTGCTELFLFFLTHLVQAISWRRAHSILFTFSGMIPRHLKFIPLYRFYLTLAERSLFPRRPSVSPSVCPFVRKRFKFSTSSQLEQLSILR